jgi:hypothetical protein
MFHIFLAKLLFSSSESDMLSGFVFHLRGSFPPLNSHTILHQDKYVSEQVQVTHKDGGPLVMNAFEMITLSQGLDLSSLFDRQQVIGLPSFSQHV